MVGEKVTEQIHKPLTLKTGKISFIFALLGDSGGVVNSLDFCPASLNIPWLLLLLVRTFFTMEGGDSEFANFTLPTLKVFLDAHNQNVSGNEQ